MKYIKFFLIFIFFMSGSALSKDLKQTSSDSVNFTSDSIIVDEKT